MATMVAPGSSALASSISIQEKGSRNKRKFRADLPLTDPNMLAPPPQTECPSFELFPTEKAPDNPNLEQQPGACDFCQTLTYSPKEALESEELQEADWGELSATQLEETVLNNLDTIYKTAIKTITTYGYTEEVATNAVLKSGLCYGCKDTVSNIVESTLGFLRSGQEVDTSLPENASEELKKHEKSVLADMVHVLREVRPFFSFGDAMWCLLICDMNVSHACAMDCNLLNSIGNDEPSGSSTIPQLEPESTTNSCSSTTSVSDLDAPRTNKLNAMLPYPQSPSHPELPTVVGIPNLLPCGRFSASSNTHNQISSFNSAKENSISSSEESLSSSVSHSLLPEVKPSKKGHLGSSKRESILRQKSGHFEKSYRAFGSKAALRAGKHSGLGGLLLEKKCKSLSDASSISMKNTLAKLNKAVGTDTPQTDPTLNLSFGDGPMKTTSSPSPLPIASTELSLSLPSTSSSSCIEGGIPSDKMCVHWGLQDKKDEMLLKLVPRVKELQTQLQEWSEWAQQKVMQAARRLSKDKPELQTLRQEKEEVARLKKEKQALEENTRKKLAEMQIALSKASSQVERANAAAKRLEAENSELRKEMEAAKLRAAESAASCQEVSKREMKTLKKFQSWERQKALFQEELVNEKRKLSLLQQQLEQAKEYQDQLEARWKQEEKTKDEALMQGNSERKEREQIEISGRAKENAIRLKAETDLQRYKEDIRRLEHQIAQLRLRTDSSKIAALKWGTDGSYASRLSDGRKEDDSHYISKILNFQELGGEEVQRERECVMCLSEEMSVVFLPCAHQVVCTNCNDLHEKQGMTDCPSCRTPIQRRISITPTES